MPFPERRNHRIPLSAAAAMTQRFRDGAKGAVQGHMFPREVIESLLNQPGAYGIRFYFGTGDDGATGLVAVAVDSDANDLSNGEVYDFGFPCPPWCGGGSALNT